MQTNTNKQPSPSCQQSHDILGHLKIPTNRINIVFPLGAQLTLYPIAPAPVGAPTIIRTAWLMLFHSFSWPSLFRYQIDNIIENTSTSSLGLHIECKQRKIKVFIKQKITCMVTFPIIYLDYKITLNGCE